MPALGSRPPEPVRLESSTAAATLAIAAAVVTASTLRAIVPSRAMALITAAVGTGHGSGTGVSIGSRIAGVDNALHGHDRLVNHALQRARHRPHSCSFGPSRTSPPARHSWAFRPPCRMGRAPAPQESTRTCRARTFQQTMGRSCSRPGHSATPRRTRTSYAVTSVTAQTTSATQTQ